MGGILHFYMTRELASINRMLVFYVMIWRESFGTHPNSLATQMTVCILQNNISKLGEKALDCGKRISTFSLHSALNEGFLFASALESSVSFGQDGSSIVKRQSNEPFPQ